LHILDILKVSICDLTETYVNILKIIVEIYVIVKYCYCHLQNINVRAYWIGSISVKSENEKLVQEFCEVIPETSHNKL
jgi:hypothetical protein